LDADEGVVLVALASGQSEKHLYSQSWYRIAGLKPRLRSHIRIQRQVFREKEWYVLQDHSTGRFHRISPEAYFITGLMDGKCTMADIWDAASLHLGDSLPTQEEIISLLSQIHRFDGLQSDLLPDMTELSERNLREKRSKLLSYLASPTSLRFPLLDPDKFLERTQVLVSPLFGWIGGLLWLSVVVYGLLLAGVHWGELTSNITDRVLSLENVLILSLVYPVFKAFHEFGHAYAVKRWGGEVHDMGIMLLVFVPIPYVDATSSYSFRDKKKRMLVGAAGIMVELFLAALAVVVWVNAGPGTVRAIAYNMMIIGGVSTLLMNGNPLIRYDAYYILSDYLEIPNLAARSSEYLGYFVKRRILGISEAASTAQTAGEGCWLAFYGITSFVYRMFIMTAIALFIAGKFFVVGILIALWTVFGFVILPLKKLVQHMLSDSLMQRYRLRSLLAGGIASALFLAAVTGVRIPSFTVVEGIVWVPIESQVNAGEDGFVAKLLVAPDSVVRRGDPLILCEAQKLDKDVNVLKGNLGEVEARYQLSRVTDRAAAEILRDEMAKSRAELNRSLERVSGLLIRSPSDGVFLLPLAEDLPGRYVKKGAPLGYVVDFSHSVVRIVVDQDDVELIRNRTRRIEARLAGDQATVIPATVVREVPAASNELPSMALSVGGGGSIALDPNESKKPQSFRKNFLFDVELTGTTLTRVGERAFIRFDHIPETLAMRWYRNIRRVLIKRFDF
jgi:putative peptide zinc metalloprotease protein